MNYRKYFNMTGFFRFVSIFLIMLMLEGGLTASVQAGPLLYISKPGEIVTIDPKKINGNNKADVVVDTYSLTSAYSGSGLQVRNTAGGRKAYLLDSGDSSVVIADLDAKTTRILPYTIPGTQAWGLSVSPEGKFVYVGYTSLDGAGGGAVLIMDADNGKAVRTVDMQDSDMLGVESFPGLFQPEGTRAYFTSNVTGKTRVMDTNTYGFVDEFKIDKVGSSIETVMSKSGDYLYSLSSKALTVTDVKSKRTVSTIKLKNDSEKDFSVCKMAESPNGSDLFISCVTFSKGDDHAVRGTTVTDVSAANGSFAVKGEPLFLEEKYFKLFDADDQYVFGTYKESAGELVVLSHSAKVALMTTFPGLGGRQGVVQ
jgi:hypothetical protein